MSQDTNAAVFYSFLLALQFGLQPMIAQRCTDERVNKTTIVVATEITKILIATLMISCYDENERARVFANWSISDSLKVAALPATLYAIQNLLVQYAYEYLPSMTFNLLNQTKTLSAALWLFILMGKKQSYMQMFALMLLLSAAVILNIDHSGASDSASSLVDPNYNLGVIFVLVASMLSGVSAALTQKVLTSTGHQRNSFFLSAELAVYGIMFLSTKELYHAMTLESGSGLVLPRAADVLRGWDVYTLIPVVSNALGGLVVGLVTKYAGGVIKGFALIAGLVFTGIVQWLVEGTPLEFYDWVAAVLVSISIVIHTSFPPSYDKPLKKKE